MADTKCRPGVSPGGREITRAAQCSDQRAHAHDGPIFQVAPARAAEARLLPLREKCALWRPNAGEASWCTIQWLCVHFD